MYERILVPLDGSDTAARGLDEALRLARLAGSTVVLLHVIELHPMMVEALSATVWEQLAEAQRRHAQGLIEAARQRVVDAGLAAEAHVVQAEPGSRVADTLVRAVHAQRCQLVVMGTHGRRGMARALLGSDAESLLRVCPAPVLLVR